MQVKKQQVKLDMEQQTGSKLGKQYIKAVYCHLAYLTYMHSTAWEMPDWMKHKLESRLLGEISITSDNTTLMAESEEELKSLLMKEESEKVGLKQHSKNWGHGIQSHHFMANRWGNNDRLYFLGFKITADGDWLTMKLEDTCSLEEKLWPT